MRTFIALLVVLAAAVSTSMAQAAAPLKELRNAVSRGNDGGTTFTMHMASGEVLTLDGDDYASAELWYRDADAELPVLLLLYQGSGEKKHDIVINLEDASYYRIDIEKGGDGGWLYQVHVYW